jgi:UDP-glucose 4-epimerase
MKLSGKSVLVTGGAGFIGSHLVDRLITENPSNLVVVDNFFLGSESNLAEAKCRFPQLKLYRLDASDLAGMQQVLKVEAVQVVFNLAVVPLPTSLTFPSWTIEKNIGIATTFCELARWGCIETLIHCSSSEAYGSAMGMKMDESHPLNPTTPYAASKAAEDSIVLSYVNTFSIDAAIVRPFNNYGPRQNPGTYAGIIPIVVKKVLDGKPVVIFGDGEQTRDFIFVRETASAFIRVYEEPKTRGRVLNIATGHETSVNELVRRLLAATGKSSHLVTHAEPRPGDVRRHCGDIRLAKELIGFCPFALSPESLEETVHWYMESYKT